jgi:hypothetical protein
MPRKNLWGELPEMDDTVTPLMIMRDQANVLRDATKGVLVANIETTPLAMGRMRHDFYLVAPLLNNYRHLLFSVEHGIEAYPVSVTVTFAHVNPKNKVPCKDQTAFENLLAIILKHKETQSALSSLIANSRAVGSAA